MRDAIRIQLTPSEYRDHMDHQREQILHALLKELRRARETKADWYEWIRNGRPVLTEAEYDRVGKFGRKKAGRGGSQ